MSDLLESVKVLTQVCDCCAPWWQWDQDLALA